MSARKPRRALPNAARVNSRILAALAYSRKPVSTSRIVEEAHRWGRDRVGYERVFENLQALHRQGLVNVEIRSSGRFWSLK